MQVQFLQAARLGREENAKIYSLGVHEVPEEHLKDPYFKMLVDSCLAIEPTESAKPQKSLQERQKELAKKILSKPDMKAVDTFVVEKSLAEEKMGKKTRKG